MPAEGDPHLERFDEFVERCLYDPSGGFYAVHGNAGGSGGDFITSVEVGPLFGVVIARALDGWWHELGRPDTFTVIEGGAGRGALARSILAASPECVSALRLVTVERSARLRAEQAAVFGLEVGPADGTYVGTVRVANAEVRVDVRGDLDGITPGSVTGVVLANELLDNLAFRMVERTETGWAEVSVALSEDGRSTTVVADSDAEFDPRIGAVLPDTLGPGQRVPICEQARAWVSDAIGLLERGRVVMLDYGVRSTTELVGREWLRTYRSHVRATDVLDDQGRVDITCDVPFDQLPSGASVVTQREFLERWGIVELTDEGRRVWQERAHLGDLEAIRARSRVTEAAALSDAGGLGGFLVAEWSVG